MKEKRIFFDLLDAKREAIGKKLADKNMEIPTELVSGIIFFILGIVVFLIMPSQVPISKNDVVNGRAFPKLLMTVMMLASAALIIKELYGHFIKKRPWATKKINLLVEAKALEILAILLLTYLVCRLTQLFVVGAVLCAFLFLIYFRCRKKNYYIITISAAVIIWASFRFGLGVRF